MFLCREVFESDTGEARIPASVLRDRLAETLDFIEERERTIYGETDDFAIDQVRQSFRHFVRLCEEKERQTGRPVLIVGSW